MATLKMRYGGNIISLPEGAVFSPGNYGTARLNYRVNSSSVGELGLTTNTNAKEYCGLQIRVGGQICFIGRKTTTSYISGNAIDYHGSSTASRSSSTSSSSEYKTSTATIAIDYHASSMSTSTSNYTQVTSTEQVQTNYYTYKVLSKTEIVSYNNGNDNGTSAAAPSLQTLTNSTGSTVTSRTASEKILTNSSFKESYADDIRYTERVSSTAGYAFNAQPSAGANHTFTFISTTVYATDHRTYSMWNSHTTAKTSTTSRVVVSNTTKATILTYYKSVQNGANTTAKYNTVSVKWDGFTQTYNSSQTTQTKKSSVSTTYTTNGTIYTTRLHYTTQSSLFGQNKNSTTYGSYDSRWTYYWSSCKYSKASYYSTHTVREYSTRSYTGTTYYSSITRSTTSVSETIHNMNV